MTEKYQKGDARKLMALALAIEELDRPTLTTIVKRTGQNKGTIDADVVRLREQFGVEIAKQGAVYKLTSWGSVLEPYGLKQFFEKSLQG
jgi:hypothetical protein